MAEKLPVDTTVATSSESLTPTSTFSISMEKPPFQLPNDIESAKELSQEWKPQKQEYLVMFTLAIISLMVALDATVLVPVLPVSLTLSDPFSQWLTGGKDNSYRPPRQRHGFFLGWHILPVVLCSLSTFHRGIVRHLWSTRIIASFLAAVHHWIHRLWCCSQLCGAAGWSLCSRNRWWWHHRGSSNHLCRYHSPQAEAEVVFTGPHSLGDRNNPWSLPRRYFRKFRRH